MASVFTDNVQCPLCGASTAHTNLECNTNEREWDCERCGFHSNTRVVVRAGKLFWEHAMQMPMTGEGKVAWPKMEAVQGGTWSRKDFGVMPGFEKEEKMTEAFGVEEAE
jgi:hypothetical protein